MKKFRIFLQKYFYIGVFLIVFIIYQIFTINSQNASSTSLIENEKVKDKKIEIENIAVDIKGAVHNPGVYILSSNMRIKDVIDKAGGFLENADTRYINLSKKIEDEMTIIIYTKDEINSLVDGNQAIRYIDKTCICPNITNDGCIRKKVTNEKPKEESNGIININTASKEELISLEGIGEAKAKLIIDYREKKPFENIEDIKNVKGIGEALFEKIKDRITV